MEDSCCKAQEKKDRGLLMGFIYGIMPHSFCIGFIIFSIIGSASLAGFFKSFMLIPYFIHALVVLSLLMATISAIFYLKRNNCLCGSGIKTKWKYLTILYGVTIFVNLFMFSYVLPALANINFNNENIGQQQLASLSLAVQIPCSGHAPLIIDELKKDNGVKSVIFETPNVFDVKYNPSQTSTQKIMDMEIFKNFPVKINN